MTDTVPAEVMAAIEAYGLACFDAGIDHNDPDAQGTMPQQLALVAAIAKALDAARREGPIFSGCDKGPSTCYREKGHDGDCDDMPF